MIPLTPSSWELLDDISDELDSSTAAELIPSLEELSAEEDDSVVP